MPFGPIKIFWEPRHLELSDAPLFPPYIDVRSKYPLFYPLSHSCTVLLILSVNPALSASPCRSHYSKPDLSPFPPHRIPKQGQSCNPFTAPLSTNSSQIILKDLQPSLGTIKGGGRGKKRRIKAQKDGEECEECSKAGGWNLCYSNLSLCHAGGAQGFPPSGQRDKLKPM